MKITNGERLAVGIGLGIVAIAISPTLRDAAIEFLKMKTRRDIAANATIDVEWIDIDVSDLTLH